ncbi:MAG: hypothetical protein AAGG01_14135 [Planctomycetota bacterium]
MTDPYESKAPLSQGGVDDANQHLGEVHVGELTDADLGIASDSPAIGGASVGAADPERESPQEWDPVRVDIAPAASSDHLGAPAGDFTRSEPLVVLISPSEVEVLAPRTKKARAGAATAVQGPRLIQFSHDLELGKPLAKLIVAQLKEHGVGRRAVRLALSPEILPTKIIEVPSLAPRDLHQVVARRAAAIIEEEPLNITFSALALDGEDKEERRWLVHPIRSKEIIALQTELRSLGWSVRDVVPGRTAPFIAAGVRDQNTDGGASIVIVFDHDSATLGLVSKGRLAHISTLPGSLEEHVTGEQASLSLVQELRGIDAFWRRSSRGDQVTKIMILGAVPAAMNLMAPAIRSALGDVAIEGTTGPIQDLTDPGFTVDRSSLDARIEVLRALRSPRASILDLGLPLRPRARSILGVGLASLVLCSTVALGIRHEMSGLASSISTEARVVAAASADLEDLMQRRDRVTRLEQQIREDCDELRQLESFGVAGRSIVAGLRGAFFDDVRLLSFRVLGGATLGMGGAAAPSAGGVLHVRGLVIDGAGRTSVALDALRRRLALIPGVASVTIDPPSLSDRGGIDAFPDGASSLRFLATARLVSSSLAAASSGNPEELPGTFPGVSAD